MMKRVCEEISNFLACCRDRAYNYSIGDLLMKLRKFLLILAVLVTGMVSLAAAGMTVEWEWLLDDPEVTAYRYQLGGEAPDGWTVVSAYTDTYKVTGLDPYQDYTLYLQRTYDGENWSPSASSTAYALLSEGEEVTLPEEPQTEEAAASVEPVAESVVEEETVSVPEVDTYTYSYDGYDLTIVIGDGYADLLYPSVVTDEDAAGFFAYEMEKYGSSVEGITYSFIDGGARLTLPSSIDRETAKANAPVIYEDIVEYITTPAPAAVQAEEPAPAAETPASEPVLPAALPAPVVAEKDSPFAFSLLFRFGAGSRFTDQFSFSVPAAQFGIGLDFKNIIPVGDHFGFGLRSDITIDFLPKGGEWNLKDNLEYFNVLNYVQASSIDLKITADITGGPADFYLGGGVGYSITNPANDTDNAYFNSIHTLSPVNLGTTFNTAWFASGVLGIRFYCCDLFSIGVEAHYRYYMPSGEHYGSADLVFGFTF